MPSLNDIIFFIGLVSCCIVSLAIGVMLGANARKDLEIELNQKDKQLNKYKDYILNRLPKTFKGKINLEDEVELEKFMNELERNI